MSNYEDLIEFRNKLVNDSEFTIYEEDCQLLDRVLDDYEQLKHQLAITEKALELACKELRDNECINCEEKHKCNRFEMCNRVLELYTPSVFKEQAKEILEYENLCG